MTALHHMQECPIHVKVYSTSQKSNFSYRYPFTRRVTKNKLEISCFVPTYDNIENVMINSIDIAERTIFIHLKFENMFRLFDCSYLIISFTWKNGIGHALLVMLYDALRCSTMLAHAALEFQLTWT